MTHLLLIFIAGFIGVFALGFQSRAVNHGNYILAGGNSMFIGFTQSNIWKLMDMDRSSTAALVYSIAGAIGIVSSMYVHNRWFTKKSIL